MPNPGNPRTREAFDPLSWIIQADIAGVQPTIVIHADGRGWLCCLEPDQPNDRPPYLVDKGYFRAVCRTLRAMGRVVAARSERASQ